MEDQLKSEIVSLREDLEAIKVALVAKDTEILALKERMHELEKLQRRKHNNVLNALAKSNIYT